MARVKSSDQIETLERQQKDLLEKLKAAKAKARAEAKENEDRKALLAGRVILGELAKNASGVLAVAFRAAADKALKRSADRALFDLPELRAETELPPPSPPPMKETRAPVDAE